VRRLLRRLHDELNLPVYCLLDCDPWGHYIYSVIKQGSINLAYESERMAVPDAKFIGLRARDYQRCGLSEDVKIKLNDRDIERAKQIAEYPVVQGPQALAGGDQVAPARRLQDGSRVFDHEGHLLRDRGVHAAETQGSGFPGLSAGRVGGHGHRALVVFCVRYGASMQTTNVV